MAGPFSENLNNDVSVVRLNGSANLRERHPEITRIFLFGAGVYSLQWAVKVTSAPWTAQWQGLAGVCADRSLRTPSGCPGRGRWELRSVLPRPPPPPPSLPTPVDPPLCVFFWGQRDRVPGEAKAQDAGQAHRCCLSPRDMPLWQRMEAGLTAPPEPLPAKSKPAARKAKSGPGYVTNDCFLLQFGKKPQDHAEVTSARGIVGFQAGCRPCDAIRVGERGGGLCGMCNAGLDGCGKPATGIRKGAHAGASPASVHESSGAAVPTSPALSVRGTAPACAGTVCKTETTACTLAVVVCRNGGSPCSAAAAQVANRTVLRQLPPAPTRTCFG